ncbi:MAG: hypothetical protein RML95_12140 [Anaerolineae bacterium]|nr:hypothetical protein [Anaerolineae bacterium]
MTDYKDTPPFLVQVVGWSQTGKTVYLDALTLMLQRVVRVWQDFLSVAANDEAQTHISNLNASMAQRGELATVTQRGIQAVYIMLLKNMPRWGNRAMLVRDCAGEYFDTMKIPVDEVPYLLHAPTALLFVSLHDLAQPGYGRTMDMLFNNYINTLLSHKFDFKRDPRSAVIVLSKGDKIPDLPNNLRQYLADDPIWHATANPASVLKLNEKRMAEYVESMTRVSDFIQDWLTWREPTAANMVRHARDRGLKLRFSVISSTGADVNPNDQRRLMDSLAPRRVLDPFFWAMEFQSR